MGTIENTALTDGAVTLKKDHLSFVETLGQSVANVAPTFMPAIMIATVAGIAGTASWLVYALATISLIFVALNVARLAGRYATAGSFFVYISRTMGPMAGMLAGWAMIVAYLFTAMAVTVGVAIFVNLILQSFSLSLPSAVIYAVSVGLVWLLAYRDIKVSSRIGLGLEIISVGIILAAAALVLWHHAFKFDMAQFSLQGSTSKGVMQALVLAIFSFVGFESATSLGREARNPLHAIPKAVVLTPILAGAFFVLMAYTVLMGFNDDGAIVAKDSSPLNTLAAGAGAPWLGLLIYVGATISSFACALASLNAAARLLFSMGRYQFIHDSMGLIHTRHRTPHLAVSLSAVAMFLVPALMFKYALIDALGYLGTIATFGFIVVYFLISVAAPLYLKQHHDLKLKDRIIGAVGALAMAVAMVGSVYPVPDYPYNILPYFFLVYMALGALWFLRIKLRSPQTLVNIEKDLEMSAPG
ncbi:MAG: APC family permease [Gammaproteobacteria bacterium]|nr:APC family permease [Gammaproteobacteria bacterium]